MAKKKGSVIEFDPGIGASTSGLVEFDPQAESTPHGPMLADLESVDTYAIDDAWVVAQNELEAELCGDKDLATALMADIHDGPGADRIVGTAIGFRTVGGMLSSEPVLKVYVNEELEGVQTLSGSAVPTRVGGLDVNVEEVGEIVPFSYARRYPRPVPCGVSVGHPRITAGTLGCLVALRNRKLCLLSNNHVIANSNDARIGDPCLQPGPHDRGRPEDRIAILEDFVRINFPGPNTVDAAVAWTAFNLVKPEHVTYTMNPQPISHRLGMTVMKNGRTTQATMGVITDVSVRISIPYSGGVATFRDQIGIRGTGGVFSMGGDSGSVIVTLQSKQPVALLFAGRRDNSITFANPIGEVMRQLDIDRFVANN